MTFTGEAPLLNVSQSQVGLSVEEHQLEELPLSRRDYLELATLDGSARELGERSRLSIDGANPYYRVSARRIPEHARPHGLVSSTPDSTPSRSSSGADRLRPSTAELIRKS
jgi:hypothetical protein